jgi:hypothetical protein
LWRGDQGRGEGQDRGHSGHSGLLQHVVSRR